MIKKMLLLLSCLPFSYLHGLTISTESRAEIDIVINRQKANEVEKNAASELGQYLSQTTGARFIIRDETEPGLTNAIYIGPTDFATAAGVNTEHFDEEEWLIQSSGDSLIIVGGRTRGPIYGVHHFLNQFAGVSLLDFDCTVIKKQPTLQIPDNLLIRKKPAISQRYPIGGFRPKDMNKYIYFLARNGFNAAYVPEQFGSHNSFGSPGMGHTFYAYSKDFPKDKPEYFSLDQYGHRLRAVNSGGPGQVCLSNAEVRELFYQKLISFIERDIKIWGHPMKIYVINSNDNNQYCVCSGCMNYSKNGGNYTDTLINFINAIATRLKAVYPEVKIATWGYTYTFSPPKIEKPLDNVYIQITNLGQEFTYGVSDTMRKVESPDNLEFRQVFDRWRQISSGICIWDYWIIYNNILFPYINTERYFEDAKFFAKNRISSYLIETEEPAGAFFALRFFLALRLTMDPLVDRNKLLDEFFQGYYESAAPYLRQYFELLESSLKQEKGVLARKAISEIRYLNKDFFNQAEILLNQAEKACRTQACLNRVRTEYFSLDNARYILGLYEDRNQLIDRMDAVMNQVMERWNYPQSLRDQWKNQVLFMRMNVRLPEQFRGRDAVDFNWPELRGNKDYNMRLVDDREACGGKALRMGEAGTGNKTVHKGSYVTGVYNTLSKTFGPSLNLKKFPQDEKYHLYRIGRFNLMPGTILHATWTWNSQTPLDRAYPNKPDNPCDIYVSLKFEGPAYVKGSTKENAVYMDRIIVNRDIHQ